MDGAEAANHARALAAAIPVDGPLGLLLDFDGTLSEIVARPQDAVLRPQSAAALARLVDTRDTRVALISGRALDDLARRAPREKVWLVGGHGSELAAPDGARTTLVDAAPVRPAIADFLAAVGPVARELDLLVEDKGVAAAVHVRDVAADRLAHVTARITGHAERLARSSDVSWIRGRQVIELRARRATKGHAVRELIGRWPPATALVAIGDDTTDEDMFLELARRPRASTIKVGPGPSAARARLADPASVGVFLELLAERRARS